MTKRIIFMPLLLIAGLFFLITYSFGGQATADNSGYYAQEDENTYCCCRISDGDSDEPESYDYQNAPADECAAQGGACVAASNCKE